MALLYSDAVMACGQKDCKTCSKTVLVEEEHVECRPERITDAVDENVDIHLICKYFTYDAWLLVEQVLKRKQKKMTWIL